MRENFCILQKFYTLVLQPRKSQLGYESIIHKLSLNGQKKVSQIFIQIYLNLKRKGLKYSWRLPAICQQIIPLALIVTVGADWMLRLAVIAVVLTWWGGG